MISDETVKESYKTAVCKPVTPAVLKGNHFSIILVPGMGYFSQVYLRRTLVPSDYILGFYRSVNLKEDRSGCCCSATNSGIDFIPVNSFSLCIIHCPDPLGRGK